jgi:hypothetical protein
MIYVQLTTVVACQGVGHKLENLIPLEATEWLSEVLQGR